MLAAGITIPEETNTDNGGTVVREYSIFLSYRPSRTAWTQGE
jgi:hypothetical protein